MIFQWENLLVAWCHWALNMYMRQLLLTSMKAIVSCVSPYLFYVLFDFHSCWIILILSSFGHFVVCPRANIFLFCYHVKKIIFSSFVLFIHYNLMFVRIKYLAVNGNYILLPLYVHVFHLNHTFVLYVSCYLFRVTLIYLKYHDSTNRPITILYCKNIYNFSSK